MDNVAELSGKQTTRTTPKKKSKVRRAAEVKTQRDQAATVVAIGAAITTVLFSMILNVAAFTASGTYLFGFCLGVALPLWVLAATFIGQRMHKDNIRLSMGAYGLAVFMLMVSLPHLANGFGELGLQWWEGWALAIVTDLMQIVMKLSIIAIWSKS